jgi:hypothetical protein
MHMYLYIHQIRPLRLTPEPESLVDMFWYYLDILTYLMMVGFALFDAWKVCMYVCMNV